MPHEHSNSKPPLCSQFVSSMLLVFIVSNLFCFSPKQDHMFSKTVSHMELKENDKKALK